MHFPLRLVTLLIVLSFALGLAVDAASVTFSRLSTAHEVRRVGHSAVEAVKGRAVSSATASAALQVARREGRTHDLRVQAKTFRLYRDGRLQLTATTTAPTLLIKHVTSLRHFTRVTSTVTVTASPYS